MHAPSPEGAPAEVGEAEVLVGHGLANELVHLLLHVQRGDVPGGCLNLAPVVNKVQSVQLVHNPSHHLQSLLRELLLLVDQISELGAVRAGGGGACGVAWCRWPDRMATGREQRGVLAPLSSFAVAGSTSCPAARRLRARDVNRR